MPSLIFGEVSLWMESIEPGKPLSFLDAHVQCGNSLLGATPALLKKGIPDEAFEPIEGDDKKICSEFKKKNKAQRAGWRRLFDEELQPWKDLDNFATKMFQLDNMEDNTVADVRSKQEFYERQLKSDEYRGNKFLADAWCAAFVWKKTSDFAAYPITEEIFRKIEEDPRQTAQWIEEKIQHLVQRYQFFHWHLAFPEVFRVPTGDAKVEHEQAGWSGGFDVVLGNPPWERIKIQEKEWFATRKPEIVNAVNAAQRKRMIEQLQKEDAGLYSEFCEDLRKAEGEGLFIRFSGRFPLCGRGDINTYSVSTENMRGVIGLRGRVGCIVPSGIATDDTTKHFFQHLMNTQTLASFYAFENREKLFEDVDSRYTFCLLTLTGSTHPITIGAEFTFFALKVEDLENEHQRFILSANDMSLLNPNTRTCPIFRSKRDMLITKAIYERVPVLIKEGVEEENLWGISFNRMFDMANDSHLFRTRKRLQANGWELKGNLFSKKNQACLPLYEGKMIWHYDHRFNGYEAIDSEHTGNRAPSTVILPRYWIHTSEIDKKYLEKKALLVYRDITNSTNQRTAIFSIIPVAPCGHTLPVVIQEAHSSCEQLYLASNTSSFVFDYVARQKLGGTHMTFFILKQLPALPPTVYAEHCTWNTALTLGQWITHRALELTYTAWDLAAFAKECGYDGPPFRWDEERRFLLRCELDAAYFHLYGINREDVDYIMETFPIVKREDEKQYGEYRTRRVILEIYDEMARAMETGESCRTRLVPGPADLAVVHEAN